MDVKSSKPKKQRRKHYSMKLHEIRKTVTGHLCKELRKKYGKRAIPLRKGDEVKIMKGKFKKKRGKITRVDYGKRKVFIEKINMKKADGSEIPVPFQASSLLVMSLMLDDERRLKKKKSREAKEEKAREKKEEKKQREEEERKKEKAKGKKVEEKKEETAGEKKKELEKEEGRKWRKTEG